MTEIKHAKTGEVLHTVDAVDLVGADLSGLDLSDACLMDVDLSSANLSGAKLCGANLQGTKLNGTNLSGADLSNAQLEFAQLYSVVTDKATVLPEKWEVVVGILNSADACVRTWQGEGFCPGWDLEVLDPSEADVAHGVDLSNAWLQDADLRLVDYRESSFLGTRLERADLRGAMLDRACFDRCRLVAADFSALDNVLTGGSEPMVVEHGGRAYAVDPVGSMVTQLRGTSFCGSMLNDARFNGADMRGADLTEAELRGADFWGSDLTGARLCAANLVGADFRHADLSGADLRQARFSTAVLKVVAVGGESAASRDFLGYLDELGEAAARGPNARTLQVEFHTANLQSARLVGANLAGAVLRTVNLAGCDLRGAELTGCDLRMALYDGKTRWPDGFDAEARGAWAISTASSLHYIIEDVNAMTGQAQAQDRPEG